jgi:CRP-like cAMP-binding protein
MPVIFISPTPLVAPARQKFKVRAHLPVKQNFLWKIETGVVRTLTWLEDGTIVTIGLSGPGAIVGQVLSTVNPYQIEALTAVEASPMLPQNGSIDSEWILPHLQQAEELLVIRSHRRVDLMLVKLLAWLSKRFGQEVKAGHLLDLRLTHNDLAELIGTTRVTVTRVLAKLEAQGVIERLSLQRILLKEDEFWHYEI